MRRRRRLVLASSIGGVLLGVLLSLASPPAHSATSTVLLVSSSSGLPAIDAATQAEIALSERVLGALVESDDMGLTARDLRGRLSVSTPTTSLLEITARARDGAEASRLSAAVADAYVAYTAESSAPLSDRGVAQLEVQVRELREQTKRLDGEIKAAESRQEGQNSLDARALRDAELLGTLVSRRAELAVQLGELDQKLALSAEAGSPFGATARVIQAGGLPSRPSVVLHTGTLALVGGLAGAAAGSLLAIRRQRRDPTIFSREAIGATLGLPIVAAIDSSARTRPEEWRQLLHEYEPSPEDAWAVRRALMALGLDEGFWDLSDVPDDRLDRLGVLGDGPAGVGLICLPSDPRGQSLGPLLARITATLGVRTTLQPASEPADAGTLWAGLALSRQTHARGRQPGLAIIRDESEAAGSDVTYGLAVVQPGEGLPADLPPAKHHLLCIGPNVATVQDLARIALDADTAGRPLTGIVLADPARWVTSPGESRFIAATPAPLPPGAARVASPAAGQAREVERRS